MYSFGHPSLRLLSTNFFPLFSYTANQGDIFFRRLFVPPRAAIYGDFPHAFKIHNRRTSRFCTSQLRRDSVTTFSRFIEFFSAIRFSSTTGLHLLLALLLELGLACIFLWKGKNRFLPRKRRKCRVFFYFGNKKYSLLPLIYTSSKFSAFLLLPPLKSPRIRIAPYVLYEIHLQYFIHSEHSIQLML